MAGEVGADQVVGDGLRFGFGAAAGAEHLQGDVVEFFVADDHVLHPSG